MKKVLEHDMVIDVCTRYMPVSTKYEQAAVVIVVFLCQDYYYK